MKEMSKKQKVLLVVGVLAILTLLIGVSYAYWMLTFTQTDENIVNTGCFKIEFTEQNPISLNKAYPMSDIDGMKNTPYTFTIQNVCDSSASFQINLESLVPSGKVLPDNYIKTNLSEGTTNRITTKLLDSIQTETTISGAVKAYKLYTGILDPNETKEFNLRLWMDEDVEAVEDSMNASYSGKVSIIASYYQDNRGTMMIAQNTNSSRLSYWAYRDKITKVVMEDTMSPKETDLTWDVSSEQNGSVMSYLLRNEGEEELYTLYLQSDGGIKANSDSGNLFSNFTKLESIEGLEYFDTSKVRNMSSMFFNCRSLTSLDVSHFDTSKVTNMSGVFSDCRSLASLDVSHFDTSQAKTMGNMFYNCSNLTSLDVSHFDTSQAKTMEYMFYNCSSLTSLDMSHFDTSNVTRMDYMFGGCSSLASLNLSSFNTNNVTNMKGMLNGCSSLTSLDLSRFDASNVTDMSYMFYNCSSLTSLDLSSFDTSKVTNMQSMFSNCQSLASLDLSRFDTSKVTNMSSMFSSCSSLTSLDLSSFDTSSVTDISSMFYKMSVIVIVKVKDGTMQNWVLTSSNAHPSSWTTENVVIAS